MSIPALLVALDYVGPVWRFHCALSFHLGSCGSGGSIASGAIRARSVEENLVNSACARVALSEMRPYRRSLSKLGDDQ
jgi:hypothetical protein